jgi:von Willebrand factor type A domain
MRRLNGHLVKLALISVGLVACGFSPGPAGEGVTTGSSGSSGSSGNSSGSGNGGSGGGTLVITGVGLNGGGGDVTGGGGTMTCGVTNKPVMPEPPDVLIIQDKSASMNDDDSGNACNRNCTSKWTELTTALSTVIQATDTSVNWGLKYFSDNNACDASNAPAVAIAPTNGAAVTASITATRPGGNTPTRDAVSFGAQYLSTLTDTNPKFLLLATDGLPNCPVGCAADTNPMGMCTTTDNPSEDMAAEMAVSMAAMMGYQTFVIGIGNVATAQSTLNQLAVSGGQPQTGAATSYYAATDEASLEAALMAIVGKVASCTIPLPPDAVGQTNVAVSVQDSSNKATKVPQDNNNGWSYANAGMTSIQLNGSYCTGVKGGSYSNVEFLYSCNGMPICIDKLANGQCGD